MITNYVYLLLLLLLFLTNASCFLNKYSPPKRSAVLLPLFISQQYCCIQFSVCHSVTLQLHVDLSVSFRNGQYRWILCLEGSFYSFGHSLRGHWKRVELVWFHSFWKRWDLLVEGSEAMWKEWNNSVIERQSLRAYPFVSDMWNYVNKLQRMTADILCIDVFR